MTETYNAGEHVKIVRTDPGYDADLGDQTGLVGTIVEVSRGGGYYVVFPHKPEDKFYYVRSEVERPFGATPPVEPLKIGDWVKVEGYTPDWDGTMGRIESFSPSGVNANIKKKATDLYPLTFPKANLVVTEEPIPTAKFAVGDWVQVTGYTPYGESTNWEGVKGKVTMVGNYDTYDKTYTYVIATADSKPYLTGGFEEKYLKVTTAPRVYKFKVGDWVEVTGCCSMPTCNGTKWQVEELPGNGSNFYNLKAEGMSGTSYNERYLKATTKPEAPHWTEAKPVGATASVLYNDGSPSRVIVKIADDMWQHVYQNRDGMIDCVAGRSNRNTKNLLDGNENMTWLN